MRILALDLSKVSTGWAFWDSSSAEPLESGYWELGSSFTEGGDPARMEGRVFCNLHKRLTKLCGDRVPNAMWMEEALDPRTLSGRTHIASLRVLTGLNAHAKSWAVAKKVPIVKEVNLSTWRRTFLGSQPRRTKRVAWKAMAIARCRELGFKPCRDDEAEAIAILTHACLQLKIQPYWLMNEVLRPMGSLPMRSMGALVVGHKG